MSGRYTPEEIDDFAADFERDGFVILRRHFDRERLLAWREAFQPLLDAHLAREAANSNRGAHRHYVTLPFAAPFDDPHFFEDADVLAIVERVAGADPVMCQLATDLSDHIISLDLSGANIVKHYVAARPQCPSCGRKKLRDPKRNAG